MMLGTLARLRLTDSRWRLSPHTVLLRRQQFQCQHLERLEVKRVLLFRRNSQSGFRAVAFPWAARGIGTRGTCRQFQQSREARREILRLVAGGAQRHDCFLVRPRTPATEFPPSPAPSARM